MAYDEDEIDDRMAYETIEALFMAYPTHKAAIQGCMWMSREDGVDCLKHRSSRRTITYDQATGIVRGTLDTGEESDDADAVLKHLAII